MIRGLQASQLMQKYIYSLVMRVVDDNHPLEPKAIIPAMQIQGSTLIKKLILLLFSKFTATVFLYKALKRYIKV